MSIRVGKFVIIPMDSGHVPDSDVWLKNEETGEGMGTTMEKLEECLQDFWEEQY